MAYTPIGNKTGGAYVPIGSKTGGYVPIGNKQSGAEAPSLSSFFPARQRLQDLARAERVPVEQTPPATQTRQQAQDIIDRGREQTLTQSTRQPTLTESARESLPTGLSQGLFGTGRDFGEGRRDTGAIGFFYDSLTKTDQQKFDEFSSTLQKKAGTDPTRAADLAAKVVTKQDIAGLTEEEKKAIRTQKSLNVIFGTLDALDAVPVIGQITKAPRVAAKGSILNKILKDISPKSIEKTLRLADPVFTLSDIKPLSKSLAKTDDAAASQKLIDDYVQTVNKTAEAGKQATKAVSPATKKVTPQVVKQIAKQTDEKVIRETIEKAIPAAGRSDQLNPLVRVISRKVDELEIREILEDFVRRLPDERPKVYTRGKEPTPRTGEMLVYFGRTADDADQWVASSRKAAEDFADPNTIEVGVIKNNEFKPAAVAEKAEVGLGTIKPSVANRVVEANRVNLDTLPAIPEETKRILRARDAKRGQAEALINQRYSHAVSRTPLGDATQAEAAKKVGGKEGMKKLVGEIATPIASRLRRINEELALALRKFEFNTMRQTTQDSEEILPLLEATKKMSKEDQRIFDLARKNRDQDVVDALATKYNIHDELNRARDVMDGIFERAKAVGMDITYAKNHWPRMLKNPEKFMAYLRGREDWGVIERMMKEAADKKGVHIMDLTTEEQATLVNNFIRGYGDKVSLAKPSFTKGRSINILDENLNQFYESTDSALSTYIVRMNDEIEARRFFGKELKPAEGLGDRNISDSIGSYVLKATADGKIKPSQQKEVADILRSRFHRGKMNAGIDFYRNAEYISTMGSPISALTQIGDLGFSLFESGFYHTLRGMGKSAFSKQKITKEMLGIENVMQEFTKDTFSGKMLDKVFKAVGLSHMDNFGKETLVNGAFSRKQALAKKNDPVLQQEMEFMFGAEEAALAKQELIDGKYTPRTMEMAFNTLADYQPVAKSEMPQKYLEQPNGRLFYMLKSFTLKQYDIFRTKAIDDIVSGDPKRARKGMKNLIRLAASFVAANATADEIKDLVLGRETPPSDKVVDNLWRLAGATKYDVYRARTDGVGRTVQGKLLFPTSIVDRAGKDIYNTAVDKEYSKGPLKGEGYKLESTQTIPVGGKLYYWWFGRGAQKEEFKAGETPEQAGLPALPKTGGQTTPELPELPKLPKLPKL